MVGYSITLHCQPTSIFLTVTMTIQSQSVDFKLFSHWLPTFVETFPATFRQASLSHQNFQPMTLHYHHPMVCGLLNRASTPPPSSEPPSPSRSCPLAGIRGALRSQCFNSLGAASTLPTLGEVGRVELRVEVGVGELVADGHPAWSDCGVAPE